MKKSVFTVLVVLAMLATFVGTVGAAPQVNVKFLGGVWTGGPVVFSFEVDQDLSGHGWITGSVVWGDQKVEMTCNQEENIVKCSGPKSAAGQNITVLFQGYAFQTYVQPKSCYGVHDWSLDGSDTWVNYGTYCQDDPANYGDVIQWYNADWGDTFQYEFLPVSPDAETCIFPTIYEDAYYYPSCPFGGPI